MHEYALMTNLQNGVNDSWVCGTVTNIVMTTRSLQEVRDDPTNAGYEVVPLERVSQMSLAQYGYWAERP